MSAFLARLALLSVHVSLPPVCTEGRAATSATCPGEDFARAVFTSGLTEEEVLIARQHEEVVLGSQTFVPFMRG